MCEERGGAQAVRKRREARIEMRDARDEMREARCFWPLKNGRALRAREKQVPRWARNDRQKGREPRQLQLQRRKQLQESFPFGELRVRMTESRGRSVTAGGPGGVSQ